MKTTVNEMAAIEAAAHKMAHRLQRTYQPDAAKKLLFQQWLERQNARG